MSEQYQWNIESTSFGEEMSSHVASSALSLEAFNDMFVAAKNPEAQMAQAAAPQSALPEGGGMNRVTAPRGSDVVQQLDRTVYNRTPAEQLAFELADRILPRPGQNSRSLTPAQIDALAREFVGPGMQQNATQFLNYLQRCLRAAGFTNAGVTSGTEVINTPPSNPASAYYPPPIRIPYIEIRDRGMQVRIQY